MTRLRVVCATTIAAVVLTAAVLSSSLGANSEPHIPFVVAAGGAADGDAFFIRHQ